MLAVRLRSVGRGDDQFDAGRFEHIDMSLIDAIVSDDLVDLRKITNDVPCRASKLRMVDQQDHLLGTLD